MPTRSGTLGRALLFMHLALSPLLFSVKTVEAFEYNKVALLLLVAIALSALALAQLARMLATNHTSEKPLAWLLSRLRVIVREPVAFGFVLYCCSAVASTLTSISPRTSLWGAHESFAGLVTVLSYTVLFFATRWLCVSVGDARRLLMAPTIGAAVASTYAIVQLAQIDPISWDRVASFGGFVRPFATMGHPNLLAAFLVMAWPIMAYVAQRAAKRRQHVVLSVFGLTSVLSLIAITISVSRGAWLALACVVVVLLLGGLKLGERRIATAILVLIPLVAGSLVVIYVAVPGGDGIMQSIAARARHLTEAASRQHIWRASLDMFKDAPLFGRGLDAFQLAFEQKRTVEYWLTEWQGTPTKAHNEVLHILATQGLFGAAATVILTLGLVLAACRTWRQAPAEHTALLVAVFAGIVGFYVQTLFSFTTVGCGTLFVTFAALLSGSGRVGSHASLPTAVHDRPGWFAVSLILAGSLAVAIFIHNVSETLPAASVGMQIGPIVAGVGIFLAIGLASASAFSFERLVQRATPWHSDRAMAVAGPQRRSASGWLSLALPVGVWAGALLLMYMGVYHPLLANWACRKGSQLVNDDWRKAIPYLERAVALDPTKEIYWVKLGTACQIGATRTRHTPEQRRWLMCAREAFAESVRLVPANSYNHANLGRLLGELAREGLANPAEAFTAFDTALVLDRHNVYFYAAAGNTALVLGDYQRAKRYAARGTELYPRFGPSRSQLGAIALLEKRFADAARLLHEALNSDWYGDENGWMRTASNLAAALLRLDRVEEASDVAREALARALDYPEAHFNLARVLEISGRRAEAIGEYRRLLRQHPDHAPARQALQGLGVPLSATPEMLPAR